MANTAAKKITYDGKPVQVESAVRDGTGKVINTTYLPLTGRVFYAIPNETTATDTLTATISNFPSTYTDGIMIALRMPFANSASSTLNVNGLGAKPVYFNNITTTASRWAAANTVQMLVYETTTISTGCWKAVYAYDGNDTTRCLQSLATEDSNRPLLMSYANTSSTTSSVVNVTYRNNSIYANPSTGKITATSGSVTSGDAQLVTGGTVYTALQSYVPTSRTVNSKALSSNITLNGADVALTGYSKPSSGSAVAATDTVNAAIGKLEKAIEDLPEPMLFKGTLGTGGTITSLPTASASNEGWVYKVITAGTYASQAAKVGDLFICANTSTTSTPTYAWTYVPSGDEPSGTVTNVATGAELTGGPITTSGTIAHATSGVTAGTYQSVTVNTYGHVTAGSNPFIVGTKFQLVEVD